METEYKHAIGIILLVVGGLATFWSAGVWYAVRTTFSLGTVIATVAVAIVGLVMQFLK